MCIDDLLRRFYVRVDADNRITVTHISLYMALVHEMIFAGYFELLLRPDIIMRSSKINSKVTYHRSMRALHDYGYIFYSPSFSPGESKCRLLDLQ